VGYEAGYSNTTGTNNTVIGRDAGYTNLTGAGNVFMGEYAGRSTTNSFNTFLGTSSGWQVTSGHRNTILGRYNGNQGGLDIRTANNNIVLSDGDGNPRMHIDSSGNIAGTASGSAFKAPMIQATNGSVTGYAGTTPTMHSPASGTLAFSMNGAERMRIDSSGNVSMNGIKIYNKTNNTTAVSFRTAGVQRGYIQVTDSATYYNTSSDYRLKTDAQPMSGASARVQALNPVNFEWISDGTRVDGFLAHEAQAVVPESVTGTKDAMMDEEYEVTPAVLDDDGNVTTEAVMGTRSVPDYQGIDQSKLVPLLTAALQEALAKIDAMETRLTALEGA
jgi:hypothetical protein